MFSELIVNAKMIDNMVLFGLTLDTRVTLHLINTDKALWFTPIIRKLFTPYKYAYDYITVISSTIRV
jgi:hypothetical protein